MPPPLPKDIVEILSSLGESENKRVQEYILSLGTTNDVEDTAAAAAADNEDYAVPHYSGSGEDYEKQSELKRKAADAKNDGKLEEALQLYNEAVEAAPPSALLYANRSIVLVQLGHFPAAELDCKLALEQNPDSAKALKTRGKLRYQHLQDWEGALRDLGQAQSIDFDPEVADILKELTKKRVEKEKEEAEERIRKEEALRKKAEDIKKAQEEAKREADEEQARAASASMGAGGMGGGMPGTGGMPDMGGMGGMPGMGGMGGMGGMPSPNMMAGMMNDPEIKEAMKNPKVMNAFKELSSTPGGPMGLMSNPGKLQEMMGDPEVGPFINLLMKKMMGGGGGGGFPAGGNSSGDDDMMPDLDDMPDLE